VYDGVSLAAADARCGGSKLQEVSDRCTLRPGKTCGLLSQIGMQEEQNVVSSQDRESRDRALINVCAFGELPILNACNLLRSAR
jgi:hypothetical protein